MNNYKVLAYIGGAFGVFGIVCAIGYAIKIDKLCTMVGRSIDDLSEETTVDIPEAIVEQAVTKAVDQTADRAVRRATERIVNDMRRETHAQIKTAVDTSYSELKRTIARDMARQAAEIDLKELKDEVVQKAKEQVLEKFDGDLDSILEKYNRDLENVGKIYKSIAKSMSKDE